MMPMPRPNWCGFAMLMLGVVLLFISLPLVGIVWLLRAIYRPLRMAYCWLWYVVLIRGPFALYEWPKWAIRHGLPLAGEYAHWDMWGPR